MFDIVKVGKNISSRRKALGMTQMELADKLGISYQAVSNWERGQTCPDISKLDELADVLGCSIDELLGSKRTAEVIKQVADEDPNPDITPEELADVAPILKPEQVDRTFGAVFANLGEVISNKVNEAIESAGIQEKVEAMQDKMRQKIADAGRKLESFDPSRVRIVPHDTDKGFSAEITIDEDKDKEAEATPQQPQQERRRAQYSADAMINLAPFLPTEALNEMLLDLVENNDMDMDQLAGAAPFVDSDVLGKAAKKMLENGAFSMDELVAIAPFLDEEDIVDLCRRASGRGGEQPEQPDSPERPDRPRGLGSPFGRPWSRK